MDEITRLLALAFFTSTAALSALLILFTVARHVFFLSKQREKAHCGARETMIQERAHEIPSHDRAVREAVVLAQWHLGQAKNTRH